MVLDKLNLLGNLSKAGPLTLDVGCGPRKKNPASIGIDAIDYPGVDLVGDVYEVLAVLPTGSVDGVYTSHFMEHIQDVQKLLGEFERVLKPGGELQIIVPHFSNPYFYSDPTHRTFFGLYTFCYFAESDLFSRKVPTYGYSPKLLLKKVHLRFKSPPPFYFRYGFKRVVELIVNLFPYTQEFYEEMLSGLLSCYEIEYTLSMK